MRGCVSHLIRESHTRGHAGMCLASHTRGHTGMCHWGSLGIPLTAPSDTRAAVASHTRGHAGDVTRISYARSLGDTCLPPLRIIGGNHHVVRPTPMRAPMSVYSRIVRLPKFSLIHVGSSSYTPLYKLTIRAHAFHEVRIEDMKHSNPG